MAKDPMEATRSCPPPPSPSPPPFPFSPPRPRSRCRKTEGHFVVLIALLILITWLSCVFAGHLGYTAQATGIT